MRKRHLWLAAAIVAALPFASACEANYTAASQDPVNVTDGVWGNTGHLELRNVVAVSDQPGQATLVATIFNRAGKADKLTGVVVPDGGQATMVPVSLPASSVAVLGGTTTLGQGTPVGVHGKAIRAGDVVRLDFEFEHAAPTTLDVQVVAPTGGYADVPPPKPLPKASKPPQS